MGKNSYGIQRYYKRGGVVYETPTGTKPKKRIVELPAYKKVKGWHDLTMFYRQYGPYSE